MGKGDGDKVNFPESYVSPVVSEVKCDICHNKHSTENHDIFCTYLKETQQARKETVNHPAHYGGASNPYEHVKVAEAWDLVSNSFLYNCTKYICRAGKKGSYVEDLKKAAWYLQKAIELEGKK